LENIVITWRELLVGVILILAVYAAEVLLLTRSGKGRAPRRDDEARNREMQSLELEISRLHERLEKLQADVEQLKVGQASAARPYSEAVKMAEGGVDVDQLSASCGISRGEAELIIAVNRFSQQKNSL
jgi:uncharacterized protein YlxW (UPF0749 family)